MLDRTQMYPPRSEKNSRLVAHFGNAPLVVDISVLLLILNPATTPEEEAFLERLRSARMGRFSRSVARYRGQTPPGGWRITQDSDKK